MNYLNNPGTDNKYLEKLKHFILLESGKPEAQEQPKFYKRMELPYVESDGLRITLAAHTDVLNIIYSYFNDLILEGLGNKLKIKVRGKNEDGNFRPLDIRDPEYSVISSDSLHRAHLEARFYRSLRVRSGGVMDELSLILKPKLVESVDLEQFSQPYSPGTLLKYYPEAYEYEFISVSDLMNFFSNNMLGNCLLAAMGGATELEFLGEAVSQDEMDMLVNNLFSRILLVDLQASILNGTLCSPQLGTLIANAKKILITSEPYNTES